MGKETLNRRIEDFVRLGSDLKVFTDLSEGNAMNEATEKYQYLDAQIRYACIRNPWFTPENVQQALRAIVHMLQQEGLNAWLSKYTLPEDSKPKTVAIIMAGNIPLVGFHDLLSVLLSGNKALIKCSSEDAVLMPILTKWLIDIEPSFDENISFTEGKINGMDAVIATGSNNTARYFEYYFSKVPHIFRKSRNSVAVIDGNETDEELNDLAKDVFSYFGLGCRNVSKLYIPENFDKDRLFKAFFSYKELINHKKYGNNYDYNKTVYLLAGNELIENGFLLLKEDTSLASPMATLFYETYSNLEGLKKKLDEQEENIQCVVSHINNIPNAVPFGKAQEPDLWDYADGVDTMAFLLSL